MNKEKLIIKNYKCFTDQTIEINNLTVLVGANGVGKSTTIQSLLLMRKSIEEQNNYVALDGIYGLDLGTSGSVINQNSNQNKITFILENFEGKIIGYCYEADSKEDKLSLRIAERTIDDNTYFSISQNEFYYLSAERRGPRISQSLVSQKYLNVGIEGENTAQVIASDSGRTKVESNRMYPDTENPNLEFQVNSWLGHIMPGVRIVTTLDVKTLTAQLRIGNNFVVDPTLATNFGFGVSYFLPLLVEGLIAKVGSLFIVENPEAHLHPAAQTAVGIFLARMAYSGLRVIVETHSDHVISGIQRFVAENVDWHDQVTINNFGVDVNGKNSVITPISFDDNANYSVWPEGFMDQSQKDYIELCKIRAHAI